MSLLDLLPKSPVISKVRPRLTAEHKTAILSAMADHQWTTARDAYGWAWNNLGVRVTYVTFWRFMTSEGLFDGDTPRARRLRLVQQ